MSSRPPFPVTRRSSLGTSPRRARSGPRRRRGTVVLSTVGITAVALGAYGVVHVAKGGDPQHQPHAAQSAAAKVPAPAAAGAKGHSHTGTTKAAAAPTAAMPPMNSMRMPTDKASRDEMARVMALVPTSAATAVAVRSGLWTDTATWRGGAVPKAGAKVVIPAKVAVTYATTAAPAIGTIRVDGTLAFDRARRSRLVVETIVVTHTGTLQVGTPAAPVTAGVEVVFAGRGAVSDAHKFGRGLISMGRAVITGRTTTPFLSAGQPARGARTLQLPSAPKGWAKGDTVTVSGTSWRGRGGPRQDETRRIAAISGTTLTLDKALRYDHRSPVAGAGAYVAHTTRNVTFRSASTKIPERGHVMFMHSDAVVVHGAAFLELGRTDKTKFADTLGVKIKTPGWTTPGRGTNPLGRYALHLHRAGLTAGRAPISVSGNAIVGSPGWGLVNHSSNVAAKDNVAVDVLGSAFVSEVGDETGSFTRNIAIGSDGLPDNSERHGHANIPATENVLNDMWANGIGFGMRSNAVALVGNVATDQAEDGFGWNGWDAPAKTTLPRAFLPAGFRNLHRPVRLDEFPVVQFKDNVAVANYRGAHFDMAAASILGTYSVVDGFTAVNNEETGLMILYAPATLRKVRVVNARTGEIGIELGPNGTGTRVESDYTLQDVTVRGFKVGVHNEGAKRRGDADRPADTYAYGVNVAGNTKGWASLDGTYLRQLATRPAATLTASTNAVKASPFGRTDVKLQVRDGLGLQKPIEWLFFGDDVKAALKRGYRQDANGTYVQLSVPIQSRVTGAVKEYKVRVGVTLSEWPGHGPKL